jgi:hypothetical protein
MIGPGTPLPSLAAIVSEACRKNGIEIVLSGGACVSIYTRNRYESFDLDFVLAVESDRRKVGPALEELGFRRDGRHFRHPRTAYIVEFLSPPLSVGNEPVREVREIRREKRTLKLLSPTDCVKDRLAAFYHWNDRPSLDQALLVCRDNDADLREVRRWSLAEGMKEKYAVFRAELKKKRGTP